MSSLNVAEDVAEMPNHNLTTRPAIAKIKHAPGNTIMYSDPSVKPDPDARGIRLAVGATKKTWVLSKRIDGKVRSVTLGAWPDLPTVYAARDVAKEKMEAITTRTDDRSTGIHTLRDAMESHIEQSDASEQTKTYYREQIERHLAKLFDRPIDELTLPDLERALAPYVDVNGKPTSTQQHLRQIIGTAFKRASVVRRIPNVADALKKVKYRARNNKVKFDVDEAWPALDLIDAKKAHNLIIGTAWEVMLFTGLRAKNVTELRWEDIDLESARLRVAELKNGTEGAFPIADRVAEALRALPQHSEWVFPQHDTAKHIYHPQQLKGEGVRMTPHDTRRLFTTAARRLRLPSYIIDQLRGDVEKGVQDIYDQGSMSHADANAIAKQIEVECGAVPSSNVVQIGGRR
ncbi:tyrosine-type recombinase/integrase [Tritonibacter horizontis]|uniref:Putative prophage CPS-53 integrase n=1 Tax=Tritonibacter horizontis TaxID=1768241 RepID=A0A132BYA0_9RHOB|nr:tyrosine-type recombinase/integrase [Tritonibacter horizontis]KUP92700.1 putative prophage CPS-53 integrase [Tritonibacter horizontis]